MDRKKLKITRKQAERIERIMPEKSFVLLKEIVETRRQDKQITEQSLAEILYESSYWPDFERTSGGRYGPSAPLEIIMGHLDNLEARGFVTSSEGELDYTPEGEEVYQKVMHPLVSRILFGSPQKMRYIEKSPRNFQQHF